MSIDRLTLRGVRNLEPLELAPAAGVNWFFGANGAGKTSILEAIVVLARGRSFRAGHLRSVIQHQAGALSVVARLADSGLTLGVERRHDSWRGRIAGQDSQRVSEFARALPLVLIEPESHLLIAGGPDHRRRYLDWLLFHVEHDYLPSWRRYSRLLRQRNAALRQGADDRVISALEVPMAQAARPLNELRAQAVSRLVKNTMTLNDALGFRLPGVLELNYRPGHPSELDLEAVLADSRERERERGFTVYGPHRAELGIRIGGHAAASELSRGQQKLLAVLLLLSHLQELATASAGPVERHAVRNIGAQPMLLLDDPQSELDAEHLACLLEWLEEQHFQSWVTSTSPWKGAQRLFHVEHGRVRLAATQA